MMGLLHHGDATSSYHAGDEQWAPIMGLSYGKERTLWSDGSYEGANNPNQDDLGQISGRLPTRGSASSLAEYVMDQTLDIKALFPHGVSSLEFRVTPPYQSGFVFVDSLTYADSRDLGSDTKGSNALLVASVGKGNSFASMQAVAASETVVIRLEPADDTYGIMGQVVIRVRWQVSAPSLEENPSLYQSSQESASDNTVAIAAGVSAGVVVLLILLWVALRRYRRRVIVVEKTPLISQRGFHVI